MTSGGGAIDAGSSGATAGGIAVGDLVVGVCGLPLAGDDPGRPGESLLTHRHCLTSPDDVLGGRIPSPVVIHCSDWVGQRQKN